MPKVLFKPSVKSFANYTLHPLTKQAEQALAVICSYGNLPTIAKAALNKGEYANTDSGHGLEYPTREDRADQVRIWYWQWRKRKGQGSVGSDQTDKIIKRKFHIPEKVYLGVLVGVLDCNGYLEEANLIRAAKIFEPITVQYVPNIFNETQYKFEPFSYEAQTCLRIALSLKNLQLSRELAMSRTGFEDFNAYENQKENVPDEFRRRAMRFENESIVWEFSKVESGKFEPTKQVVSESLYWDILEQILFIHALPSLRAESSNLSTIVWNPSVHNALNYTIIPREHLTVALLEIIVSWVRLEDWIKIASNEKPYTQGIKLENQSSLMILGDEITLTDVKHKKHSVSKILFLSVLNGILHARGMQEDAISIQNLMPLDTVIVEYKPDLYSQANYQITNFDARASDCLSIILCRQNLELVWDEAKQKRGFQFGYYYPTFSLNFYTDGNVELKMPNGNDRILPEDFYLNILEQVVNLHKAGE